MNKSVIRGLLNVPAAAAVLITQTHFDRLNLHRRVFIIFFFLYSFVYLPLQTFGGFCRELIDCEKRGKAKKTACQEKSFTFHYRRSSLLTSAVWRLIKIHSSFVPLIFALLIIFLSINFFPSPLRDFFVFFFVTLENFTLFSDTSVIVNLLRGTGSDTQGKGKSQYFPSYIAANFLFQFFNFSYCHDKTLTVWDSSLQRRLFLISLRFTSVIYYGFENAYMPDHCTIQFVERQSKSTISILLFFLLTFIRYERSNYG